MNVKAVAQQLFDAVRPGRVTIRGAAPGEQDPTFLHVEVRASGAPTMVGAPQDGIPSAPTYLWLREHRAILVQNDCLDDPRPPRMLTDHFGVTAQLLGPLLRDGVLVGSISVHQQGGPRTWSEADVRAVAYAVQRLRAAWCLDGLGPTPDDASPDLT